MASAIQQHESAIITHVSPSSWASHPFLHPTLLDRQSSWLFFLNLLVFNWRIIALLYCAYFCHTSTWISHGYRHMFPSSWTSLPPPISSHPSRLSQITGLSSWSHIANSHWPSILDMAASPVGIWALHMRFAGGSVVKNPPTNAGDTGDMSSTPGSEMFCPMSKSLSGREKASKTMQFTKREVRAFCRNQRSGAGSEKALSRGCYPNL